MVIKLSAISFSASMDSKLCVLTRQIQVAFHSTLQRVQPTSFSKSRSFSQATTRPADGKMEAWVSPSYGAPLIRQHMNIPRVLNENQVLLRVKASSVNPIDLRMADGYGRVLLKLLDQCEGISEQNPFAQLRLQSIRCKYSAGERSRLPLITGRDCSAEVVEVGRRVDGIALGDEVIAVIPVNWQGAHSQYVLTQSNALVKKPESVGHVQAASLGYVACTTWSALVTVARINPQNCGRLRVLIHGSSGGVGTFAIQLLKYWGVEKIVGTCSAKNVSLVQSLGLKAIDYNSSDAMETITAEGPFDVVLDCAESSLTRMSDATLGLWRNCIHVTLVSPLLGYTDRYGLPAGLISFPSVRGRWFLPAYFQPSKACLDELASILAQGKIKPIVTEVYPFSELPKAYSTLRNKVSGKIVIDFDKNSGS